MKILKLEILDKQMTEAAPVVEWLKRLIFSVLRHSYHTAVRSSLARVICGTSKVLLATAGVVCIIGVLRAPRTAHARRPSWMTSSHIFRKIFFFRYFMIECLFRQSRGHHND